MPSTPAAPIFSASIDPAPELTAISDTFTNFLPLMQSVMVLLGVFVMIFGLIRVMNTSGSGYTEGWSTVIMGAIAAAGGFFVPMLLTWLLDDGSPAPEPTATPSETASPRPTTTSEPTRAPETMQEPADLTWLWVTLGIIAGLVLLSLLIWIIVTAGAKARRGIRETREKAAAELAAAQRRAATWKTFHDRHNELLRKYLHSETDWDSLFFTPALTDPSVPQTYAMLRAMRAANTLRDTAGELPADLGPDIDLTRLPYPRAVEEFALAWDAAERYARRIGQKGIPAAERKLIKQIRTFLDMAENSAASQNERNLAYRRAQSLIESLETIHVPAQAIAQLEERHQLMLTSS